MRKIMKMNIKGPLPKLPEAFEMTLVQGEIPFQLREEIDRTLALLNGRKSGKASKLKIRQVIEWGLAAWLLQNNPQAADRLGIKPKE